MSGSDPGTLTVIIPSRNRHRSVRHAIDSATRSGVSEVIVVDDHSSPALCSVLGGSSGARVIESSGRGVCAARNTGARQATTSWICFLDDDDRRLPAVAALDALMRDPSIGLIAGAARLSGGRGCADIVVPPADLGPSFGHMRACVLAGSWMIRRDWFLACGGYCEELRHSENTELFLRLAEDVEIGRWRAASIEDVCVEVLSDPDLVRASKDDAAKVDAVALLRQRHRRRLRRDPAVLVSTLRAGAVAAAKTGRRRAALAWFAECVVRGDTRSMDAARFVAAAVPGLNRVVWHWSPRVGRRIRQPARSSTDS